MWGMKIHDLPSLNGMIRTATGVDRQENKSGVPSFRQEMSQLTRANCEQKLDELLQKATQQGNLMANRCDLLELKRYKEMVAEFMYEAVRFSFAFKKQSTIDARGRHRLYALIKRVNQRIEALTAQMLSGQADNLSVMAAVDELRGLLMDLYL